MSYDALRCCFYGKPLLRGWLHLALFHASLVTGTLVPIAARGSLRTAAVAIYVAAVSALFGTSALYHRGRWTARQAGLLQRLDHSMIFLLIAGTATPAFLIDLPGRPGVIGVFVLWTLTLGAAVMHLLWMEAPELLVGAIFVALGCAAGAALRAVWMHSGPAAGLLMLTVVCSTCSVHSPASGAGPIPLPRSSASTRCSTHSSRPRSPASTSPSRCSSSGTDPAATPALTPTLP